MAQHNRLGTWGEDKAVEYLRGKGYDILERDWKHGKRDIDIIARKDNILAIIEVKTRSNTNYNEPQVAVDRRKIMSISLSANAYVRQKRINATLRFDIITIVGSDENNYEITHLEDAFLPSAIWRY